MTNNRPCFLALRVRDFGASLRFYRDAIGIPIKSDETGSHHEYSWEDPYYHFSIYPAMDGEEPSRLQLGFAVDDLDAIHARAVSAGARVIEGPKQEPWGATAWYADPDGNTVTLTYLGG